jgi:hypothetical protein
MLDLCSGRNALDEAVVTISSPSGVTFRMEDAEKLRDSFGAQSTSIPIVIYFIME